ncbi:MAG: hypothetical protein J07HN4v3_03113 [Halonotius sp. J07HN4]|nr:MAG: hypothetical protein J07HN4v3_03113 [Halonotius sp. J07HN4]
MLNVGETVPEMTLPMATPAAADTKPRGEYRTADIESFELRETLTDGPVTLVTLPGVYSQGCTEELCTITDRRSELGELPGQVYASVPTRRGRNSPLSTSTTSPTRCSRDSTPTHCNNLACAGPTASSKGSPNGGRS